MKANTAKKRTHSLFGHGADDFMAMPRMSDGQLLPLAERFNQLLRGHAVFQQAFGYI